jgi:hypothetical protein
MYRRDLLRLLSLSTLAGATGCGGVSADPSPAAFSRQTTPPFGFVPDVEFTLTAAPDEAALFPGAPTRVWRFTGLLLKGPDTLETLPVRTWARLSACAAASRSASASPTSSAKTRSSTGTAWTCPTGRTAIHGWQ